MFDINTLKVYFIAGSQDVENGTLQQLLKEAIESGITMFQFREKGPGSKGGEEKEALASSLFELCQAYGVPFIINDDVDLALKLDADGIHVGQDDLKISSFKEQFKDKIIGLSVANIDEYKNSEIDLVDYIGTGPIHTTTSKDDAGVEGGYALIETLRNHDHHIPIVAIGGITTSDVTHLVQAGADGISMISAITKSKNIEQTVKDIYAEYKKVNKN